MGLHLDNCNLTFSNGFQNCQRMMFLFLPQGYRQKDYFIATQGPLPHTVEDFWRMVWEWKCHTIVMLTEVLEREQV